MVLWLATEAIARAISMLLTGNHWAAMERKLVNAEDQADLNEMPRTVGNTVAHEALAQVISLNLYQWLSATDMLVGFSAIHRTLVGSGIDVDKHPSAARFVLTFADAPADQRIGRSPSAAICCNE